MNTKPKDSFYERLTVLFKRRSEIALCCGILTLLLAFYGIISVLTRTMIIYHENGFLSFSYYTIVSYMLAALSAAFGKALQIKPLISADESGKLVNVGKIRGKSNVIPTLVEHLRRDADPDIKKSVVFVAHADNIDGAKELRKAVKGMCKDVQICDIGPIIGSHVGSGMLALVFLGERNLRF